MAKKKIVEEPAFETVMSQLEAIVDKLESGDAGLEEALAVYAQGVGLVSSARQKIEAVEKKIEELEVGMKPDDAMVLFDTRENSDE